MGTLLSMDSEVIQRKRPARVALYEKLFDPGPLGQGKESQEAWEK